VSTPKSAASGYDFSFDGIPKAHQIICPDCGEKHDGVTGYVLNKGDAYAIYFADWYPHDNAAWVEVILGSFTEPDYADDVTIGCRYGYVDGQADPAASLFTPTRTGAIFGRILDRAHAMKSPRITDFWALTDWLVVNDALLHETVYHLPPRT
jgi:hypothetical protein